MEQIRDLLVPNSVATVNGGGGGLKIRENTQRGVYVEEMVQVSCATEQAMHDVVRSGTINRSVASTRMNKDSSRSHCILMINATRKELRGTLVKRATMYIVDLAGSEFVNKTNASGKVLQEARAINKSLSALSNVIKALGEGKKHVPYRDSKLTRLLQDSLGGSAKTCLILAASCSSYNMAETISTLRFGLRAKEIKNPVVQKHDSASNGGGIFRDLYVQAMEEIEEKNKTICELQDLLALAYEVNKADVLKLNLRSTLDRLSPRKKRLLGMPPGDADRELDSAVAEATMDDPTTEFSEPASAAASHELDDDSDSDDSETRSGLISELEASKQRLEGENKQLIEVIESLEQKLGNIVVEQQPGQAPSLYRLDKEDPSDRRLTLDAWLRSDAWSELAANSNVDDETPSHVTPPAPQVSLTWRRSPPSDTSDAVTASCTPTTSAEGTTVCVHRQDAEALSRQIVELKLQLHYLTESTKQSLDGEQYLIVLENAKLKTRIEELEFQANLGNVRCNQLEMKNRACETRLSNQDTHIARLQNSLQEYQGLFKQQIIMSQEKCRLLTDELEFYKKLAKCTQQNGSLHGLALDPEMISGSSSPQPSDATSSPSLPSTSSSPSIQTTHPLGDGGVSPSLRSPFRKWRSLSSLYWPLRDDENSPTSPTGAAAVAPLAAKAQRMIVKPMPSSPNQQKNPGGSISPWRRKGSDGSPAQSMFVRTSSSPELMRSAMDTEEALLEELMSLQ
ncbi:hypothetical protein PINS_up007740 [Pythium insidiosum]|nr:hypothetical protein PINS_up007740 [Pythium insidiosum]